MRPTTADNWMTKLKQEARLNEKTKKNSHHIRQPSAPARTPAQAAPADGETPGIGSLSAAGGEADMANKESGRARGNVQDLEQRGNVQLPEPRLRHKLHHDSLRHGRQIRLQHTTRTTRKPARAPDDAPTTPTAADVCQVVLPDFDQNRHGSHRQIAPFSSSCSRLTTRSSRRLRSGGGRSARKSRVSLSLHRPSRKRARQRRTRPSE